MISNAASTCELAQLHLGSCSFPRCCVRDNRTLWYFNAPKPQIEVQHFVFSNRPKEPAPPGPMHHGVVVGLSRGFTRCAYSFPGAYINTSTDKFETCVTASCECDNPGLHLCLLEAACCEYNKL